MRLLQKIRPAFASLLCRCLTRRHMQLFVGGLSYDTNESVLKDAFENYGEIVEVKVICDRVSGRSRGYGFVRYSSEVAANKALKEMDGQLLDGRNIRIHHAHREGIKEVRGEICDSPEAQTSLFSNNRDAETEILDGEMSTVKRG